MYVTNHTSVKSEHVTHNKSKDNHCTLSVSSNHSTQKRKQKTLKNAKKIGTLKLREFTTTKKIGKWSIISLHVMNKKVQFSEAKSRKIPLPSSDNVNDCVVHI